MLDNVSAERDAALSDARRAQANRGISDDGETSGGAGTREEVSVLRRDCDKLRDQVRRAPPPPPILYFVQCIRVCLRGVLLSNDQRDEETKTATALPTVQGWLAQRGAVEEDRLKEGPSVRAGVACYLFMGFGRSVALVLEELAKEGGGCRGELVPRIHAAHARSENRRIFFCICVSPCCFIKDRRIVISSVFST